MKSTPITLLVGFLQFVKEEDVCYYDVNVNSNFEEVDFSLNAVTDSSARYFSKNPKENSSFKKKTKKFKKVPVVT